jgi:hypothetical protein
MRFTWRALALLSLAAGPAAAQSLTDSLLPIDPLVTHGTLPNGLRY